MYKDSVVRLTIGKIDTSISFKVGFKQGYSMSPVLFLFVIMSFAETLEKSGSKMISINSNSAVTTTH